MRYTTLIDISELPQIYRNQNARLVYMHLALKSGYHDADRDMIRISIRSLAQDVGLTVSAIRHALTVLEKAKLITRDEDKWRVLKWIVETPPTPRRQPKDKAAAVGANSIAQERDRQLEEYRQKVYNALRQSSKDEVQKWVSELEEGRSLNHHGAYLNANRDNIEWLKRRLKQL